MTKEEIEIAITKSLVQMKKQKDYWRKKYRDLKSQIEGEKK